MAGDARVNPWMMVACGWAFAALMMAVLWLVQRRYGDAGIVDVAWGLGVGLLALFFAIGSSEGLLARRIVVAALALIWSLRLSGYIFWRLLTMPEDGRYQTLKSNWGSAAQAKLFGFYQIQAAASLLFALPMLIASRNASPWGIADTLGVIWWLLALSGEAMADRQLARFRADPTTKGQVCREGLWKYSRHPNYFFEWLHWWSYCLFAATGPWGWTSIAAPLGMLYLITRVTGIPPTEEQALKSRGDAYREYQRTTSAFIPWPPQASERETQCAT